MTIFCCRGKTFNPTQWHLHCDIDSALAMLRHRLVRQSAMNVSSGSDSTMPSPQPIRRRRNSQDAKMYRQLSSESLDNLLGPSERREDRKPSGRRHSVACGALYVDIQKPSFKAAFNTAVKRMSSACSILSSAPSSTYNLSPHQAGHPPSKNKDEEVILPHVLGTFQQNRLPVQISCPAGHEKIVTTRSAFQVNRRFSTDCPPPSYAEATLLWKQKMIRQQTGSPMGSLEDADGATSDERLVE